MEEQFVCDEFLCVRGRVVRWELAAWSASLSQALPRASALREGRLPAIAECFRDAASIAEYIGRYEDARRLSLAAIRFFAGIASRERRAEAVGLALSALVRLGRVERVRGNLDDALLHLGRARSLGLGAEVTTGALRVTRAQWESLVALEPKTVQALAFEASAEMLATLLEARRLEDVVSLALVSRRGACDPPALEWVRKEAALTALCRLGRPDEALALAARYTVEAGDADRSIFELRRAEALACFGDVTRARALAEAVAAQLDRKWRARPGTLDDVLLATRVTRLCALLGEALGAEFCWTALAEALAVGDVPLESELLVRIVETDWDEERRADASELLRAVAFGSGYRLPAAEQILSPDEGPISARGPLSARSIEERAPGFGALLEGLCRMGEGR